MLLKFNDIGERIPEGIAILRKERKLYLYGDGAYAEKVFVELEKWNIFLNGIIVSDEYYREGRLFHGLDVKPFSKMKNERIRVVAGYNIIIHEELNKRLIDSGIVEKIYYFDGRHAFACGICFQKNIILVDNYYKKTLNKQFSYAFFQDNLELFTQTYEWLRDEKSRDTMNCFLQGHIEMKDWPMLPVWEVKDVKRQYFPDDIINLSQHEIFVDCGAYTGDTLETFSGLVESFDRYYALEPDDSSFKNLKKVIEKVKQKGEVIHLPIGVSEKKEEVYFSHASASSKIMHDSDSIDDCTYIKVDSIDCLLKEEKNVTFIKMDIEGEELSALRGAQKIIQKCRPKLAICVYHKREDLITIPQYLKCLVPEYEFFLRAHRPCAHEIVLYCVCSQNKVV